MTGVAAMTPSEVLPDGLSLDLFFDREKLYLSRVAACVYQSKFIRDDALSQARWMARIPSYQVPNGYDLARYAPRPEAALAFRGR